MQKLILAILKDVPSILNILAYALLYFQMQSLFILSRINHRQDSSQQKILKIIKIVICVLAALFVIIEFFLMVFMVAFDPPKVSFD